MPWSVSRRVRGRPRAESTRPAQPPNLAVLDGGRGWGIQSFGGSRVNEVCVELVVEEVADRREARGA